MLDVDSQLFKDNGKTKNVWAERWMVVWVDVLLNVLFNLLFVLFSSFFFFSFFSFFVFLFSLILYTDLNLFYFSKKWKKKNKKHMLILIILIIILYMWMDLSRCILNSWYPSWYHPLFKCSFSPFKVPLLVKKIASPSLPHPHPVPQSCLLLAL